jgi:hypothetical protein
VDVSRQLELRPVAFAQSDVDWRRLLGEMRAVVDYVSLKQASFDLDVAPSVLANSLAERERYPRAEWIPYLVRKAPSLDLARALVEPAGLAVLEPPPISPEEELARLKETLNETLGPELRAAIYQRAGRR